MLCEICKGSGNLAASGSCLACGGYTASASYDLCESCSQAKGVCQMCGDQIVSPAHLASHKKGQRFLKKGEQDNGKTASLFVGEELHITLPEDQATRLEWGSPIYDPDILSCEDEGQFVEDGDDWQHGTRTLIFRGERKGECKLEIRQSHKWGGPGGSRIWSISVKVK